MTTDTTGEGVRSDQDAEQLREWVGDVPREVEAALALEHADGYLTARDHTSCGFIPMQGVGEHRGRSIPLHGDDVDLCLDAGQQVETAALGERHLHRRASCNIDAL